MPYFYVPFPKEWISESEMSKQCVQTPLKTCVVDVDLSKTFGMELEKALEETSNFKAQRIFNLQLVSARDFYGYHPEEQVFIKIVLYYARDVSKAAELLQVAFLLFVRSKRRA